MTDKKQIRTFENLEAWKACREIRIYAVKIARQLPPEEKYELTSQIKRAARSTTANIAEGYGRYHYQENLQFCRQARGSLYETLDHFITGNDEDLISDQELEQLRAFFEKAVQILNGYINYLDRSAQAARAAGKSRDGLRVREASAEYAIDSQAYDVAPANDPSSPD